MGEDNKNEMKRGMPGGFLWFLLGAFMIALMIQSLLDARFARVSFSYQLEHLVNLQLIQPEESRKVAINDSLVTFSGRFRDQRTEVGAARFHFLEVLNRYEELESKSGQLQLQLNEQKQKVETAATAYLSWVGEPLPAAGVAVIDGDQRFFQDKDYSVVIHTLPEAGGATLASLRKELLGSAGADLRPEQQEALLAEVQELVRKIRSPLIGISSESMKQSMKQLSADLDRLAATSSGRGVAIADLQGVVDQLEAITVALAQNSDGVRFLQLRAVRKDQELLQQAGKLTEELGETKVQLEKARKAVANAIWFFNNSELSTRLLEQQDYEKFHQWFLNAKSEWDSFSKNEGGFFRAPDQPLNLVLEKTFKSEEPTPNYLSYLFTLMPLLFIGFLLYFVFARQMRGVGSNALNFGKSPAKMVNKSSNKITFKDVAGIEEAIEELEEIVEFLRDPKKFTALGGHIPKGVLCVGAPGTGKTLIARAVAGEADRPFFSISGSEFVEMFVGVGASRIRDLFNKAKENAPCIIFIDEIDAVGRQRGASGLGGGGHDEREQTLNQLLVEMDGFEANEGVILMAATNRPDVLDKALLRPGRFDRRIVINLPDITGRFEILNVHARKIKMAADVDLMWLAKSTPGCSGADLANILNEAALLAARRGLSAVTNAEIADARDKVMYGKERRSLRLDEEEKRTTAYHEAGHTIVSCYVQHSDPVDKVTIIPRGMSLGATMFLPTKNKVSYWKKELGDRLAVLMGGRCAEEIFLGDVSSGAQQDFQQATSLARNMVLRWGMSDLLGTVAYEERSDTEQYLGVALQSKSHSDKTAQQVDDEVKRILDEAYELAHRLIAEHKEQAEALTKALMEFETVDAQEIKAILDGSFDGRKKQAAIVVGAKKPQKRVTRSKSPKNGSQPSAEVGNDISSYPTSTTS